MFTCPATYGKVQDGWCKEDDGPKDFELGAVIIPENDMILYPHWIGGGGSGSGSGSGSGNGTTYIETAPGSHSYVPRDIKPKTSENSAEAEPAEGEGVLIRYCPTAECENKPTKEDGKAIGGEIKLEEELYFRSGYVQTGWSVNEDGSTKDYELGGIYKEDADLILYPYFEGIPEEKNETPVEEPAPKAKKNVTGIAVGAVAAAAAAASGIFFAARKKKKN